jgi:hypothetical protein
MADYPEETIRHYCDAWGISERCARSFLSKRDALVAEGHTLHEAMRGTKDGERERFLMAMSRVNSQMSDFETATDTQEKGVLKVPSTKQFAEDN